MNLKELIKELQELEASGYGDCQVVTEWFQGCYTLISDAELMKAGRFANGDYFRDEDGRYDVIYIG